MKQKPENRSYTVVEIMVIYVSIGWSYAMFSDNHAFDKSENFSSMESIIGHEWILGAVCLILAIIKMTGIAIKSARMRWTGLILSTALWIGVSATFLLSADGFDVNTGFIVYSGLAVMSLLTSKEVISHE